MESCCSLFEDECLRLYVGEIFVDNLERLIRGG